jgi:hypothetical protein
LAQQCFPPKRLIGTTDESLLSTQTLSPVAAWYSFESPRSPQEHVDAHSHSIDVHERQVFFGVATSVARVHRLLERQACGWTLPRELVFNRVQLEESLQHSAAGLLLAVDRLKAVLRTGIEHWTLFNVSYVGVTATPCGWRQDSRIEVQMQRGANVDWLRWDAYWQSMLAG